MRGKFAASRRDNLSKRFYALEPELSDAKKNFAIHEKNLALDLMGPKIICVSVVKSQGKDHMSIVFLKKIIYCCCFVP